MFASEFVRAVIQIIAFSVIPLLWWLFTARKKASFFNWIGLKKPKILNRKKFLIGVFVSLLVAISMSLVLDPLLPDDIQLANERFTGKGFSALLPAIVFAFFATGLAEEVFFRGFLGKRLSNKLDFYMGNTIQAIIFGLLHGATMFPTLGIAIPLVVIAFTGTMGWLMGYINEKATGAIIPSWILHGFANLYAALLIMFI